MVLRISKTRSIWSPCYLPKVRVSSHFTLRDSIINGGEKKKKGGKPPKKYQRLLKCIDDNFLAQVMEEPTRRDTLL